MPAAGGFVAVLVIELHFPDAGSLKAKRKELSSIKAQLHGRLGAAVSETAHQDLWQRATLVGLADQRVAAPGAGRGRQLERWVHRPLSRGGARRTADRLGRGSAGMTALHGRVAARTCVRRVG